MKNLSLLILLQVLLCSSGCKKEKDDNPSFRFEKGFGKSEERPEGEPFHWPEGIRLLDKPGTEDECMDAVLHQNRMFGHSGSVTVCLNLYNETNRPIEINLPPGFMFLAKSKDVQHGLLLTWVRIEVPAKQQYFAQLAMMCVNPPRSTSPGNEYEEQPIVTHHPGLQELMKKLETKKCNYEEYGGVYLQQQAMEIGATIAVAAQDLIYGKPIHQQERQAIEAIPNK